MEKEVTLFRYDLNNLSSRINEIYKHYSNPTDISLGKYLVEEIKNFRLFGYSYGKPGSKSLKALLCRYFIENMEIIVYNPCPVRVLLSSILNHHKRDARAIILYPQNSHLDKCQLN